MGNTESTVRRITLKKDLQDDEYIENMILTERLANAYMNPKNVETTSKTPESANCLDKNLRNQQLSSTSNSSDFYNGDESVVEHMKYLSGVLDRISRRLDRQFDEINEKIQLQSEAQLNNLESEIKEYRIVNPLKEDMEQIAECFAKHPNEPLKCRKISDDFLSKSYKLTSASAK